MFQSHTKAILQLCGRYLPRRYNRWMWKTLAFVLLLTAVVAIHARMSASRRRHHSELSNRHNTKAGNDADDGNLESQTDGPDVEGIVVADGSTRPLTVLVNGEYTVNGFLQRNGNESFLPFSFIKKYFDIYGLLTHNAQGNVVLNFSHSYGEPHLPLPGTHHQASGPFMNFGTFNVEKRDRVLCIDEYGVPLSNQWDPKGFHFATQISQFGLQHYSAWVWTKQKKLKRTSTRVENGKGFDDHLWKYRTRAGAFVKLVDDSSLGRPVLKFCTEVPDAGLSSVDGVTRTVPSHQPGEVVAVVAFRASGPLIISFRVQASNKRRYTIHYDSDADNVVQLRSESIRYKLRAHRNEWTSIARSLTIDLHRGLLAAKRKGLKKKDQTKHLKIVKVEALVLRGCGELANFSLSTDAHRRMALDAANWLVENQDRQGGWPVGVTRTLKPNLVLKPGWYSAMAQGQAMSLLVRAYYATLDQKYLQAAKKGMNLFHVPSVKGGVRAIFMNNFVWYEEYPTVPSSFVLNGFIYALLGLYDLSEVDGDGSESWKLYHDGLKSLKAMAGLYDTGSGTLYDLRHVTVLIEPNRARWDYHVTHINLMGTMATIDKDPLFPSLRDRWLGYMKGHRSKHN